MKPLFISAYMIKALAARAILKSRSSGLFDVEIDLHNIGGKELPF